jgi:serine phosphatase RsbU (regulator of sigma subunit)
MINRLFLGVAGRLRPELSGMSGLELAGSLIDLAAAIYLLPFAAGGLLWLILVTELETAGQEWAPLLITLAASWAIRRLSYTLRLEVRPGVFASVTGSFETLVLWSVALEIGPTALWVSIVAAVIDMFWQRRNSFGSRWYQWRTLLNDIAASSLSGMLALRLYESTGGILPFAGISAGGLLPVAIATAAWIILPKFLALPLLLYLRRAPELVGDSSLTDRASMTRFLIIGATVSSASDPFAILAATAFAESGLFAYSMFIVGMILVAMLANRLSNAVARSEQRTRELAIIERLARGIMTSPPDGALLPVLLKEHVEGLFPGSRFEIRLFPDEILYQQQPAGAAFEASVWERLQQSDAESYFVYDALPSVRGPAWNGLAAVIAKGENAEVVGGIYLLIPRNVQRSSDFMPAVQSLAHQIGSALQRIDLHQEALEEQAQVYQQEVYAQAYQAEAYAQALALERIGKELALAGEIQASFLPDELPDVPGWQIAVTLEPAQEASGDFYDFIQLPGGRIGLLVADVAEKGMGAALYMALSGTLIRTYALEYHDSPAQALCVANRRIMTDTNSDLFVTVFYAVLDPTSGVLTYCNAGHNPPILLQHQNGDQPLALARTALPLGILEETTWEQAAVQLLPGDVLAMYTDGVTEAQDEENEFFGEQRLRTVLKANAHRSAEVIEDRLIAAVYDFAGDAPQFDDITVMIVTRE